VGSTSGERDGELEELNVERRKYKHVAVSTKKPQRDEESWLKNKANAAVIMGLGKGGGKRNFSRL